MSFFNYAHLFKIEKKPAIMTQLFFSFHKLIVKTIVQFFGREAEKCFCIIMDKKGKLKILRR